MSLVIYIQRPMSLFLLISAKTVSAAHTAIDILCSLYFAVEHIFFYYDDTTSVHVELDISGSWR